MAQLRRLAFDQSRLVLDRRHRLGLSHHGLGALADAFGVLVDQVALVPAILPGRDRVAQRARVADCLLERLDAGMIAAANERHTRAAQVPQQALECGAARCVEPGPAFDVGQPRKRRDAAHQGGQEFRTPSLHRRTEVLLERFIPFREGDDDSVRLARGVRILVPPMNAARIDDHRKPRRPVMGQCRPKEHLPHRFHRHRESSERGNISGPRSRGVDDERRFDRRARCEPDGAHRSIRACPQ